jgi:hypothetical protein
MYFDHSTRTEVNRPAPLDALGTELIPCDHVLDGESGIRRFSGDGLCCGRTPAL